MSNANVMAFGGGADNAAADLHTTSEALSDTAASDTIPSAGNHAGHRGCQNKSVKRIRRLHGLPVLDRTEVEDGTEPPKQPLRTTLALRISPCLDRRRHRSDHVGGDTGEQSSDRSNEVPEDDRGTCACQTPLVERAPPAFTERNRQEKHPCGSNGKSKRDPESA